MWYKSRFNSCAGLPQTIGLSVPLCTRPHLHSTHLCPAAPYVTFTRRAWVTETLVLPAACPRSLVSQWVPAQSMAVLHRQPAWQQQQWTACWVGRCSPARSSSSSSRLRHSRCAVLAAAGQMHQRGSSKQQQQQTAMCLGARCSIDFGCGSVLNSRDTVIAYGVRGSVRTCYVGSVGATIAAVCAVSGHSCGIWRFG